MGPKTFHLATFPSPSLLISFSLSIEQISLCQPTNDLCLSKLSKMRLQMTDGQCKETSANFRFSVTEQGELISFPRYL